MIPHSEILKCFRRRWLTNPLLTTLVPGGLHHEDDEDGEGGSSPNARLGIRHDAPEYNSGTSYLQRFSLQLTVWSSAGPVDAGKIEKAITATFARSCVSSLTLLGGKVLDLTRADGDLQLDPERHQGRGVLVTSLAWTVTVHGAG